MLPGAKHISLIRPPIIAGPTDRQGRRLRSDSWRVRVGAAGASGFGVGLRGADFLDAMLSKYTHPCGKIVSLKFEALNCGSLSL